MPIAIVKIYAIICIFTNEKVKAGEIKDLPKVTEILKG